MWFHLQSAEWCAESQGIDFASTVKKLQLYIHMYICHLFFFERAYNVHDKLLKSSDFSQRKILKQEILKLYPLG